MDSHQSLTLKKQIGPSVKVIRKHPRTNGSEPARAAERNHPPFDSPWPKPDYFSTVMGLLLFFIIAGTGFATEAKVTTMVGGGITEIDNQITPMVSFSVGFPVRKWLDIELTYAGPDSHRLEYEDSTSRTYGVQPSWSTVGIRPHIHLGDRVNIGFPIASGSGLVTYRYDSEYRDSMTWTEEYLDVVGCVVYTAATDVRVLVTDRWMVEAKAGWRATSPIRTPLADTDVLTGYYATLGSGWRF